MELKNTISSESEKKPRGFIEVTQDGIARITASTPNNIQGIYTEDLQTCLALIIVSEQSIAVIHVTNKLSADSVRKEFLQHKVKFWTFAYNPKIYPEKYNDENLQKHLAIFINVILQVAKGLNLKKEDDLSFHSYEAIEGYVSVNRNGNVNVDKKPGTIIQVPHKNIRHKINQVNNYYLTDDETIEADIQYDGFNFTNLPKLKKSDREIAELLQTEKYLFSSMRDSAMALRNEAQAYLLSQKGTPKSDSSQLFSGIFAKPDKEDVKLKQQIKGKYNLADDSLAELERGLRKAVVNNKVADIPYFIKLGVDINAVNKDGKTALHFAVELKLDDCVKALLAQRARYDILDNSNRTALEAAQQVSNDEIVALFPTLSFQ